MSEPELTSATENVVPKKKAKMNDLQNRKTRRRIWQEDEVHKLLYVWRLRIDDLRQSKKNRHIYEEICQELNRMGVDTIREEVHIKIQNLSQLYRNERRRIEATGDAPTWQYYHEVDQLLGGYQENIMDSTTTTTTLDEIKYHDHDNTSGEVVSIGDSGSENGEAPDEDHVESIQRMYKNGFEALAAHTALEYANAFLSHTQTHPQASTAPQITSTCSNPKVENQTNDIDGLTTENIQVLILHEIRRANAIAEREHAHTKSLHHEMRALEEQRFKVTQMFIERSLALQKQILDCLQSSRRATNGTSTPISRATKTNAVHCNGNAGERSPVATCSFDFLPKAHSSRPQFVMTKKKKMN